MLALNDSTPTGIDPLVSSSPQFAAVLYPGPRSTRPGFCPVYLPSSNTSLPFTMTYRIPTDNSYGLENVALSVTFS